jgi:hypothetical protein
MSPNIGNQLWQNESMFLSLKVGHAPAPPAIVPRRYGLISMTFFTVPDATVRLRNNGILLS